MLPRIYIVDDALRRLNAAGWSVGEVASELSWIVTGNNGENVIRATAPTQAGAWKLAMEQAQAVCMLRD